MKVLMLSVGDYAGSGWKICEAVRRVSDIDIKLVKKTKSKYGYDYDYLIPEQKTFVLRQMAKEADIIHFKGDDIPKTVFHQIIIPKVPIVISVGGSGFRRHGAKCVSRPLRPISQYIERTDYRTTLTPDLNYDEFQAIYTQQAIDSRKQKNTFRKSDKIIIQHSPSSRRKKGTDEFIIPAIDILKQKYNIELDIIEGVSNKECLERKKNAHIFIDQVCDTGFYGISALESMQYGIPVVAHISKDALAQSDGKLSLNPIINVEKSVESIVNEISNAIDCGLEDLSERTKSFCDNFHSYEVVGNMWKEIYEYLYNNNKTK